MSDAEVRGGESRVETPHGSDPALSAVSPARQEAGDVWTLEQKMRQVCDRCGQPRMHHREVEEFCPFISTFRAVPPSVSGGQQEPNWKALGRSAVEAAQTVIGQCDCTMSEDAAKDPKSIWRKARDAYWRAAAPEAERRKTEPCTACEDDGNPCEVCGHGYPWGLSVSASLEEQEQAAENLARAQQNLREAERRDECQAGVGPGKAHERRKCRAPAEWVNAGGMPLCDRHARYAHGPRKGILDENLTPFVEAERREPGP